MNLMGNGGPSETYTPFVRITNSYNGTRALRIDLGFLREHCSNGVIFEQVAATLTVPHTRQGLHSLMVARPFEGMGELCEKSRNTLAGIRGVAIGLDDARLLVRSVTGWPKLPDSPDDPTAFSLQKNGLQLNERSLNINTYDISKIITQISSRYPKRDSAHAGSQARPTNQLYRKGRPYRT